MPKIVDHEERRAELAAAVWRVIERDGMDTATVRAVAAESGMSAGALRHYFADQTELVLFAARTVSDRSVARLTARLALTDPRARALGLLEELLPLDADRRVEGAVWLACLTRGRYDERFADIGRTAWRGERHVCRLAWASVRGLPLPQQPGRRLPASRDESAARQLHVVIDGLTLQGVSLPDQLKPATMRRELRDALSSLETATG